MKHLTISLLVMLAALYSAGQGGVPKKSKIVVKKDQAQLEYIGSVTGAMNLAIGAQFEIDSAIGVRYDLVIERGTAVMNHTAIFYKFSNPTQSILYNYLTHKSSIIKYNGQPASGPGLEVLGPAMIDSIACTHLQHGGGTKEVSNYWMSTNVPGFLMLVNALKNISPALPSLAFNGNVFNWGGLVRWTIDYSNPKTGETFNMELHLQEANRDVTIAPRDFEVPSN